MNRRNLSPRIVEMLIGILGTGMIVLGLFIYALQEPERIAISAVQQVQIDLEDAMRLYAENCSVCHGLAGGGIGATPALDSQPLRGSDPDSLAKIISRGLFNTAMPAWSKTDGGPLSDYQISELVALIRFGDWQATQDTVVNMGLAPRVPFVTQPDPVLLEKVLALPEGQNLSRAIEIYAGQCVACHGADGLGTALAPALNDADTRAIPAQDLERTISNGVAATLMASWKNVLAPEDISNLTLLISHWDEIPSGTIPVPDTPVAVTSESLALGAELYSASCLRCHGPDGQGTQRAPALNVKSFLSTTSDAAMQHIITLGVPSTAMPAWGDRLSDAEIQAVVGYLRSWEPTAPEVATPLRGAWWRATTPGSSSSPQLPSGGVGGNAAQNAQGETPPPWARQNATLAWYQMLDWRAWLLITVSLITSSGMIFFAAWRLSKLG